MKQKEKILIGLTSLLCGSPMILFSLRNNKQKNNLLIKKEKKEENKPLINHQDQQKENKSSSFFFWTIFIIIIVVVSGIIFMIIKYCQKPRKKQPTENISKKLPPLKLEEKETLLRRRSFELEHNSAQSYGKNALDAYQNKLKNEKEIKKNLENKKNSKCNIYIQDLGMSIYLSKDVNDHDTQKRIEEILKKDIVEQQPLPGAINNNFYQHISIDFKKIIQAMFNFLETNLTSQLLTNVYEEKPKNKYQILTTMANKFASSPTFAIYSIGFYDAKNEQEADDNDLNLISKGQYQDLLEIIMHRQKATFIENKNTKEKHYLFLRIFKIYKFINQFFQDLNLFIQKHQDKYDPATLQKMQDDKENLNNLIFKNNNHI